MKNYDFAKKKDVSDKNWLRKFNELSGHKILNSQLSNHKSFTVWHDDF